MALHPLFIRGWKQLSAYKSMGLENCGHTWKMDVVTNRIKLLGLFGLGDIVQ